MGISFGYMFPEVLQRALFLGDFPSIQIFSASLHFWDSPVLYCYLSRKKILVTLKIVWGILLSEFDCYVVSFNYRNPQQDYSVSFAQLIQSLWTLAHHLGADNTHLSLACISAWVPPGNSVCPVVAIGIPFDSVAMVFRDDNFVPFALSIKLCGKCFHIPELPYQVVLVHLPGSITFISLKNMPNRCFSNHSTRGPFCLCSPPRCGEE